MATNPAFEPDLSALPRLALAGGEAHERTPSVQRPSLPNLATSESSPSSICFAITFPAFLDVQITLQPIEVRRPERPERLQPLVDCLELRHLNSIHPLLGYGAGFN